MSRRTEETERRIEEKTMRKDGKRTESAERLFQESVKGQYDCTKFCRCCPFPGLKCVSDGRTIH